MFTIFPPPPRSSMCTPAARLRKNTLDRFTSIVSSHISSGCWAAGARCIVAALFTRISIRPNASITAGTSRSVSSRFVRFAVKLRACLPFSLIAASVADGGCVLA